MMMLRSMQVARRGFATRRKVVARLPPEVLDRLPHYKEIEAPKSTDPAAYQRGPVTSAHMVEKGKISTLDSAAIHPATGTIVHGKYGDLGAAADGIPLEYIALLRPAAEACACLRTIGDKKGTVLVYGAGHASGFAAAQLASASGNAVVGVVSGDQSGNADWMEIVKGMVPTPGTAVPEEYALSKKAFSDLVKSISTGDEGIATPSPSEYLEDFKKNFVDYSAAFPDTRPAAVSEDMLEFKYMEKDRETWDLNMEAFLEQFPPGAPPVDQAKLDTYFSTEQYEIFRGKFWKQTSGVISGDNAKFSPPHAVQDLIQQPETLDHTTQTGSGSVFPYTFSVLNQFFPEGTDAKAAGPVTAAIIQVTPALEKAAKAVAAAKTKRAKAEALVFLTHAERAAFGAARSVVALAEAASAPVFAVGGSLPGLKTPEISDADVQQALEAMDIDETGDSKLNYFVQIYRANDFAFYEDYAVHRATEGSAGPRQLVVTK